jgi:hypothetical protein
MKKKILATIMCVAAVASLLSGCGAKSKDIKVTVTNDSGFIFNELYVSPTASDDWGGDRFGSSAVLKSGGSFDLTLQKYEFEAYDIKVLYEDGDEYLFTRVTLRNGTEVAIGFGDGPTAQVSHSGGGSETVYGELNGGYYEEPYDDEPTGTGYDTDGYYEFAVYNNSDYDIYAIYMGRSDMSSDADVDILPQVLEAYDSTTVSGRADETDWENTDWSLYIEDVDGDTSVSYDTFNPWLVLSVDIYWDSDSGGYICTFNY